MRKYQKPLVEVEKFLPNVVVAACNSFLEGEETTYTAQEVKCVINSSDWIFIEGTTGCKHVVDPSITDGSTYRFTMYDGDGDGLKSYTFAGKVVFQESQILSH